MQRKFLGTIQTVVAGAVILTMSGLVACGSSTSKLNQISLVQLTKEQTELTELLKDINQSTAYFDYQTTEKYNSLEIWADTYEKGELLESDKLGVSVDILDKTGEKEGSKGTIALVTNALPDVKWGLGVREDGDQVVSRSVAYDKSVRQGGGGVSWPINEPVNIEPGEDIVLYVSVFSIGGTTVSVDGDIQQFIDNPELTKDFDYVRIVKCRFSRSILQYGTFHQY